MAAGVLLALAGGVGLILAADHAPTLSNAFTKSWVLKQGAYDALRLLSFGAIGLGLLSAVAGVVRRERSQPPATPPVPSPAPARAPRSQPLPPTPATPITEPARLQLPPAAPAGSARPASSSHRPNRWFALAVAVIAVAGVAVAAVIVAPLDHRSTKPDTSRPASTHHSSPVSSTVTQTNPEPDATENVALCHGEQTCGGMDTDPVDGQCGPGRDTPCATDPALEAAIHTVTAKGYTAIDVRFFDMTEPIQAILATSTGSADSGTKRVFFFAAGEYLGTDTSRPSGDISLGFRDSNTIALRYGLWRPDDGQCCATGGAATVRFYWDGARLRPLDPIPSASLSAPLSRR
jgi:hypothetical protein